MKSTWHVPGEWNCLCDICGFQFKSSELQKNWKGQMVCAEDYETRHPSDMLRPLPPEDTSVPWTRPKTTETFIDITYTTGGSIPTEE